MNEIIFQPLYQDEEKPVGCFISVHFFGLNGIIMCPDWCPNPYSWRKFIEDSIFQELFEHIMNVGNDDEHSLSESDRDIYKMQDEFEYDFKNKLDVADLYVYSHTPKKAGGYVRILVEPDEHETVKPKIDTSDFYPDAVRKAGPVERFLYANTDEWEQYYRLPESMQKVCGKYYWRFGNDLVFDTDIIWLYFNDAVGWNNLYWDLYHAIGRLWKNCNFVKAWRTCDYGDTEKKLVAETDAQRLLFWTLENEYTLDDLRKMVSEKRVMNKHILGTEQDSWMTLQFGL